MLVASRSLLLADLNESLDRAILLDRTDKDPPHDESTAAFGTTICR
jgi:hypothetical protein